jgi:DNA-directed RNA polymerase specialized sigma24 family protein
MYSNITTIKGETAGFSAWYRQERCNGSPVDPRGVLGAAKAIMSKHRSACIDADELESFVIEALRFCFRHFDPGQASREDAGEDAFMRFFRSWFRRQLRDAARDRRSRERRKAALGYFQHNQGRVPTTRTQAAFEEWKLVIYSMARRRLSPEAAQFLQIRVIDDLKVGETARSMGVSRSKLRIYGDSRLVQIFQKEIAAMICGLPPRDFDLLVSVMHFEDLLDEEHIAQLLCISESLVADTIRSFLGRPVPGIDREGAIRLLSGRALPSHQHAA